MDTSSRERTLLPYQDEVQGVAQYYFPDRDVGYRQEWVAWWVEAKTPIPEEARAGVVAKLVNNGISSQAELVGVAWRRSMKQYLRLVDCGLTRREISALLIPLHDLAVATH